MLLVRRGMLQHDHQRRVSCWTNYWQNKDWVCAGLFRLRGCSLAFKVWRKLASKCLKGNRICRHKFHFWGNYMILKKFSLEKQPLNGNSYIIKKAPSDMINMVNCLQLRLLLVVYLHSGTKILLSKLFLFELNLYFYNKKNYTHLVVLYK